LSIKEVKNMPKYLKNKILIQILLITLRKIQIRMKKLKKLIIL